ncbi:MAG: hypothetical protein KC431_27995, partial [Myxococcales bacterium]|nr:hypothetical protein [Myxococcales bacterium]
MPGASPARLAAALALVPLLAACDPPEASDNERWQFHTSLVDRLGFDSHRVLVDSSFRLQPAWIADAYQVYGDALDGCLIYGASGTLAVDDQVDDLAIGEGRFLVTAAGVGAVELPAPTEQCPDLEALANQDADTWTLLGV